MPLFGQIIDSKQAFSAMKSILSALKDDEIWLVSAYTKVNALKALTEHIDATNKVSILCRWTATDLLSGSSDLASYSYANERSWSFFVHQDLHAKAYRLGSTAIFIGSGNLTNRGFISSGQGNVETMVKVEATHENIYSLERLFDHAVRIDENLFLDIQGWIGCHQGLADNESGDFEEYPLNKLSILLTAPPEYLMVSECFHTNGDWLKGQSGLEDESQIHDLSLLGIPADAGNDNLTTELLRSYLARTKMFTWLYAKVSESPKHEMYFGELTAELHSALIDDPRPYRSDVKSLLANLIAWVDAISLCGLCVDRPNYSQRVYLRK